MIKSDSNYKNLAAIIKEGDDALIEEAVESLRHEQPFEGAIELIAGLYDTTDSKYVRNSIEGFFNDIKDNSAKEEVMNEIKKPYKPETAKMLIASCWQSGLDYSAYLKDFAEIFTVSDYLTALECLTVIEELVNRLDEDTRQELAEIIENTANPELFDLTDDLQSILK